MQGIAAGASLAHGGVKPRRASAMGSYALPGKDVSITLHLFLNGYFLHLGQIHLLIGSILHFNSEGSLTDHGTAK
jgi:hypothetical protein